MKLQSPETDLNTSVASIKSLKSYIENLRDNFDHYESLGQKRCQQSEYSDISKRTRRTNVRLNSIDSSNEQETILKGSNNFRVNCFLPVIDTLTTSLQERLAAYEEISNYFGFLSNLPTLSVTEIKEKSDNLVNFYENDLEESLGTEFCHFQQFIKDFNLKKKR